MTATILNIERERDKEEIIVSVQFSNGDKESFRFDDGADRPFIRQTIRDRLRRKYNIEQNATGYRNLIGDSFTYP